MIEQQYRVVADRDKGDDPQPAMIQDGDRVTVVAYNAHDGSWEDGNEGIVRIERPVPTTDEPKRWPGVVEYERMMRARFPQPPTREQITDAVKHAVLDASFLSERDANTVWRRVHLALDALLTKEDDR